MRGGIPPLPDIFMTWCLSNGYTFMARYLVKHKENFKCGTYVIEYYELWSMTPINPT
jgi:hypothetical protein